MDKLPNEWCPRNTSEQKVFATLKGINWHPPKVPEFFPKDVPAKLCPPSFESSPTQAYNTWPKNPTSESHSVPTQHTAAVRSVALSPNIFASKDFPRTSVDVRRRPAKHLTPNTLSRGNWSVQSSSIHVNDDSDYSDDLYGTGRPLRPSLINSDQRVQESAPHGI